MKLFVKLISFIIVAIMLAFANFLISDSDLPSYGTWTGIRPIEDKLKKLEKFAKSGPVDAIVFGSSISDFGFSAELYSKLMSEKLGHPYRVFNFSTGSAELVTTPALYRIARTVVRPKAIFLISPAEVKRPEEISPNSADYKLSHSPIGSSLNNQTLLGLAKFVWTLPIINKAAALRDLVMFGHYRNLIGQGMDTYKVTDYGDRISYTAAGLDLQQMNYFRQSIENNVKLMATEAEQDLAVAQTNFFPVIDIKAMEELRQIAQADDLKIYVLGHSAAGALWMKPTENMDYKKGRTQYLNTLAKSVGGILVNPLDGLSVPDHAVMEYTHLNTYGADIYTRAVFQTAINTSSLDQSDSSGIEQVSLASIRSKEPTFNGYSAIVFRNRGARNKSLRCRFVENFAVPLFPSADLFFALRMPDGRDIISPVRKLTSGEYEADVDLGANDKKQALILRLLYGTDTKVPLNAPLASYEWVPAL